MMKNKIVASVEFDFKGEHFAPEATIDLDLLMTANQDIHDRWSHVYHLLARDNGIDIYSYQFEIMLEEKILFRDATGIAAEYYRDGQFYFADFEPAWHETKILEYIQPIAMKHLAIDNLSQHPKLKTALTAAFKEGKEKGNK